ncbi:hypothetical protein HU675_0000480 [Bradyrhizobium septentrionale]|uniref:hypothetical protein n=1 Tax=Bradyrhizobium septentrionale TaxID=1404411 RepID=UPI001597086B|nr:hypothetical protein [Bradyrhizobium septentrionale]UGY25466.1 hypothetical protein HU675_0000480 [Bradyrhizobium septentrionale]
MFDPLPGNEDAVLAQMRRAIEDRFYGRFASEFHRNPRDARFHLHLPRFWLFPDKPVWKRERTTTREQVLINAGGFHYNGAMLTPRLSRFRDRCPIEYFEEKQALYGRHGISRIHAVPIHDVAGISDYACKTIKWGRAREKDIVILPRSVSELENDKIAS